MYDFEDRDSVQDAEDSEDISLILDGTANVEYANDQQPPRVKGLIELLQDYLRN